MFVLAHRQHPVLPLEAVGLEDLEDALVVEEETDVPRPVVVSQQ
jgi:hypothetical protein